MKPLRRTLSLVALVLLTVRGTAGADHTLKRTTRPVQVVLQLPVATKNLSLGVSGCYLGYVHSNASGDFLLSALLNGFDHDDLDSIRFTATQTVGARLSFRPFSLERRCAPRERGNRWPDLVPGLGLWGVTEVDSLSQTFRTGSSGLYTAWSVGLFTSFVFDDITVSFVFRPFEQTAFYLAGEWDSTSFRFNNPTLEVELSYVLW